MGRIVNKYLSYGIYTILIFLLLISITTPVYAVPDNSNDTNNTYQHNQSDACSNCHNSSHVQQARGQQPKNVKQTGKASPNTGKAGTGTMGATTRGVTTSVTGNITLISSMGQDWYQQGIYGPDGYNIWDNSWGWTFFDENPPTGYIIPAENITQRDNIFALLLDDGNNNTPISGANVVADVTYWKYDNIGYTSNVTSFQLVEDPNRLGSYSGRFDFYGGSPPGTSCLFCHATMFGNPAADTFNGYFPGNYTVTVRVDASGKTTNKNLNFQVTAWGCEDCHGSGNRHRAPDGHIISADMDSACYSCHSLNDIVGMPGDPGNPHQNIGHRNINCVDCHTNKGLQSGTFNGVTFVNGGINNAPLPQYNYNVIQLNGGTHTGLSCSDCHGNLALQDIGGGYNADGYVVNDTINKYNPKFASIESFQDYYVIDVTGGGPLNINFDWQGTANLGFFIYPQNFNPRNRKTLAYFDGSTFTNKPEVYSNNAPTTGKWILQIYGYNFRTDWIGELQPPINYTINSTYPVQRKGLPSTPECNTCHNSGATGGANTKDIIPDWNPGYAHTDINGDGTLDVQCRMCHDSMHNIGVKKCQDCHTKAPTDHIITGSAYDQYSTVQCLQCHGDPHKVSAQAEQCIECHGTNYTGAAPSVNNTFVDIGRFNGSIHQNINKSVPTGSVTNDDCYSCHYNIDMNRQNVRKCGYCHNKASQWHGNANVTTNLTELAIR